jgi:hypothetical protein
VITRRFWLVCKQKPRTAFGAEALGKSKREAGPRRFLSRPTFPCSSNHTKIRDRILRRLCMNSILSRSYYRLLAIAEAKSRNEARFIPRMLMRFNLTRYTESYRADEPSVLRVFVVNEANLHSPQRLERTKRITKLFLCAGPTIAPGTPKSAISVLDSSCVSRRVR